jgi:16S rRNA processing protein RimM
LFIDLDGQRVPFFIESAELVGAGQAIVKVEFIDSLEEARKVIACDVYLDQKLTQEADSTGGVPGQMIAYRAVDRRLGEIGVISEHIPNEMNPVWVIKNAGKEIIIPATEDFIQSVDHINKVLHLDLPEGITDL